MSGSVTIGMGGSGSFSGSKSNIQSSYTSVVEQTGIKAGDGGFDVNVAGHTDLKGAVIASTQAAVENNLNRFSTGSLSTSDIENKASYKATSVGVGVGGSVTANGKQSPVGTSAGFANKSGSASSVSRAGISGMAGNESVRTGDAETGIGRIFDADKVQRELSAQVAITQAFGREAPKAAADFAQGRVNSLLQEARAATEANDPERARSLVEEARRWDEGGAYRIALHTALGGVTGGPTGALGAGAAAGAAPLLEELQQAVTDRLRSAGAGEQTAKFAGSLVAQGTAASLGAVVSGGSPAGAAMAFNVDANNRQLHPSEVKRIKELAAGNAERERRLTAAACAMVRCADGVPLDDPSYAFLKALQDSGAAFKDEQAILSKQYGQVGRTTNQHLFQYTWVDNWVVDPASQNKVGTRVLGAGQAALGVAGAVGSAALCTTGPGCVAGAVTGTVSTDYALAGARQAVSGNAQTPYGEQVFQSLGLSPEAAALTYAAIGLAPAGVEAYAANKVANQASRYNTLARASYADFTTHGIKATPEVMASPQAQALITEIRATGVSEEIAQRRAIQWIESGSSLPTPVLLGEGNALVKVVPKGDGVAPYSPFWMSIEEARTISAMSPAQATQTLGLPASQAAKILQNGMDFYVITPKAGVKPTVFASDIAPTLQSTVVTRPSAQQVIVPNRNLWSAPKLTTPSALRQ